MVVSPWPFSVARRGGVSESGGAGLQPGSHAQGLLGGTRQVFFSHLIAPLRGGRFFSQLILHSGLIFLFGLIVVLKLPVVQKPPAKKTKLLPAAL
jgi:hypothetical protein